MILYLHGFASGPGSTKGQALGDRFAALGVPFVRADLTPGPDGFERSTPLTMLAELERLVALHRPTAIMGSSLGGYLAAVAASRGPAGAPGTRAALRSRAACVGAPPSSARRWIVERIVLLAPAFRLHERWRGRLSLADERAWRERGLEVDHAASGRRRRIGWAFMEDAATLPAYPAVRIPALCVAGRRDEIVPLEDVERFVEQTPSARLVVLDDGHDLLASVDRIFEEARAFLAP